MICSGGGGGGGGRLKRMIAIVNPLLHASLTTCLGFHMDPGIQSRVGDSIPEEPVDAGTGGSKVLEIQDAVSDPTTQLTPYIRLSESLIRQDDCAVIPSMTYDASDSLVHGAHRLLIVPGIARQWWVDIDGRSG